MPVKIQIPMFMAIGIEILVSVHMTLCVLKPLARIISKNHSNQVFWFLFILRIEVLLFVDIFITTNIAFLDFLMLFVGVFIIIPIAHKMRGDDLLADLANTNNNINEMLSSLLPRNRYDGLSSYNINNANSIYDLSEKEILKKIIIEELENQKIDINSFTTIKMERYKNILLMIVGLLTFINVLLYYFNYSPLICGSIEIIIFLIYFFINKKINILDILTKEATRNPNLDITSIVSNSKNTEKNILLSTYAKIVIIMFIVVFIPTMLFFNPRIIYTKYGDGYQVFRYTRGIVNNDKEVVIASTYKGKKVLAIGERAFKNTKASKVILPSTIESIKIDAFRNAKNIQSITLPSSVVEIRANAFSNMKNLTNIYLAEGLRYIRGGAFANDINLTNVKLPSTLEYLGGRAFSKCYSITEITIPDLVTEINGQTFEHMTSLEKINLHDNITYIHGEVFRGDYRLDNVTLPSKITEIKGSTFEGCESLTSITIPDGVTRIGGHAFYGCERLSYVYVPKTVKEIGSSAFRKCYSLNSITIPKFTYIKERAFKESPTIVYYYDN